ncbi:MAG TPA: hypothetical protein VEI07_24510 [Planctomycetaceae bacterium]|nr:hypothetical protein [Planctomycetaceae bacterium]
MDQPPAIVAERFWPALEALVAAYNYAQDSQTDRWQFAIGITELCASGATLADLRWLILRGFAEHALETTIPSDAERSFRNLTPTAFPEKTCFVLSSAGTLNLAKALYVRQSTPTSIESQATAIGASMEPLSPRSRVTPEWDSVRRELRYRGQVIKRYRVPAQNQALVLTAFQESGWPECIDDPLPPVPEQDSKERLQATIKSLNRNRLSRLVKFHGNGNGQQVYWEAISVGRRKSRRTGN